ncbi:MAG TPA: c-type cytochrome domain-containing protein [Verrucomicrobiae bacterium]|nr:c-type cytochrome domain-containing protein [Verrucomicrobiae bacterium]
MTKIMPVLMTLTLSLHAAEKFDLSKIDLTKLPPASDKKGLTYTKDIRPMFETSCIRCHGEEQQKGGLRLDTREALLNGGKHGKAIVSGKSKESHLVIATAQIDDETAMPPKRRAGGPGRPGGPGAGQPGATPSRPGQPANAPPQANPGAPKGPGGPRGPGGPPAKPLTPEQVGIIRAWIDQGAK